MPFWKILLIILSLSTFGVKALSYQKKTNKPEYDSLEMRRLLDKGSDLLANAEYADAIDLFEKLRTSTYSAGKWDHYVEAYRGFAICNFHLGHYKLALENRQELIEIAGTYLPNDQGTKAVLLNDLGLSFNSLGNHQKAINYSKKALAIQLDLYGEDHINTTQTLNDLGLMFNNQSEADSALKYYKWSLDIRRATLESNDPSLANSLSNIGTLYARQINYAKQAEYYEEALKIFLLNYGDRHPSVATLYNNLAYAYGKKQDYDKQLLYYDKSLALRLKIFGENHPSVAESYHNIAGYYILQDNFKKFLSYAERSQKLFIQFYGEVHLKVASSYHMMGVGYERNGDFIRALDYYEKSVEIYKTTFHDLHPTLAIRYNNMAACYAGLKQWSKQKEFLEKALKIRIKSLGPNHSKVGSIYNNLGKHYQNVGNFNEALIQFQSALTSTSEIFENLSKSISNSDLSKANSKNLIIKILKNRAATSDSLYVQTKELNLLLNAFADLNLAFRIADLLRFEISADYSRQKVTKEIMPAYESAIRIALKLHETTNKESYLEQALILSEQSKIFQLRLTLQDAKAKQFANIPDSLLKLEANIKKNMVYLEKAIDRAKQKKDSSKTVQLKDKLWIQNNKFFELTSFLEENYPNYYELKFNHDVATLASIRKNILNHESMLVEYFFGTRSMYIFQITKETFKVYDLSIDSTLSKIITNYVKATSDFDFIFSNKTESDKLYIESSYELYKLVLKQTLEPRNENIKRLIIAADGILNLLNFDALLTEKSLPMTPNYQVLPYLINDFQISYTYSASFLLNHYQSPEVVKNDFAGFAPQAQLPDDSNSDSSNLGLNAQIVRSDAFELPSTLEEVNQINQLMNGDIWIGPKATEHIFKKEAKNYNILHLATHGYLDDHNPLNSELMFAIDNDSANDGSLSINEIYNLMLNAKLTVLSACNTGQGKILEGEGIKSLSQAFSYAGCPSVIMSLWKVPDAPTRDLMIELYKGLEQNLTKDEALRMAKISYIANVQDPLYSHPFYWSSFALMGNSDALVEGTLLKNWVFLPLLMLISIATLFKIGWELFQSIEHVT